MYALMPPPFGVVARYSFPLARVLPHNRWGHQVFPFLLLQSQDARTVGGFEGEIAL